MSAVPPLKHAMSLFEHDSDTEHGVIPRATGAEIRIEVAITLLEDRVIVGAQADTSVSGQPEVDAATKFKREVRFAIGAGYETAAGP